MPAVARRGSSLPRRPIAAATVAALVLGLAACASGESAADQARNDHDLGPVSNFALAASSQIKTTGHNVDDIARRIGAATP